MKRRRMFCVRTAAALVLAIGCLTASAQLPPDFPGMTVTAYDTNSVGSGYIFLETTDSTTNVGHYVMILKNDGTPVWYQNVGTNNYDFKILPNGLLHYAPFIHTHSWTGGGDCTHQILDDGYNLEEMISAGNGYVADAHDFQMLPNGHVLLQGYYRTQMDVSKYVVGGYPNAVLAGAIIQELDAQRNVVFQWRSWDHFTLLGYYGLYLTANNPAGKNPTIDAFHLNTVVMDTDGNLLVSNFGMDVWKINRQTGQIMWRLGGLANQFTFVGENAQLAAGHFSGHTLTRLDNGNIMIYCNADQQATRSSKIYEYKLDETNKIATLMWSYAPPTNFYAWHYGSAQRLANGNTLIGWGGANIIPGVGGATNQWIPACTEVTSSGRVVFELKFNDPRIASYRAYRFVYPPASQANAATVFGLIAGNSYTFGGTGVSLDTSAGGGGYNQATVTREPYAPVNPQFNGTAPRLLPARVSMTEVSISDLEGQINFDSTSFGFADPGNLTVYYRGQAGQGLFVPLDTAYNFVTKQLQAMVAMIPQGDQLGEFAFGYPDVAQVTNPPILAAVENYRGVQAFEVVGPLPAATGTNYAVNQQLPISLAWSPNGLAGWYQLQIDTTTNFASLLVDIPYQTDSFFVWSNAAPGTTYYYHVNTWNDAGTSDWANGSFRTVPPMIAVTAPNGGEAWQRGLNYFVQWNGNTPEPVAIDLYKGGVFLKTLATNANTGAYRWSIGFNLSTGRDYSIAVRSTTTGALTDVGDLPFSIIDAPSINAGSVTRLQDGSVQFGYTAPGASQMTVLGSTNLNSWQVIQTLSLTNDSGIFTSAATPSIPNRFYRLRVP